MNLTFKGFLRGYVRELTQLRTDNLRKLCHAVEHDAPAAAEALMVFAAMQGKAAYLARLSEGTWMQREYAEQATILGEQHPIEDYLASEAAPMRYQKVWNAYVAKRDASAADRRISSLMRQKTLDALQSSGTTIYRLCKDLGLNLGNVYAYLNNDDPTKVSKATARRIMEYATSRACRLLP